MNALSRTKCSRITLILGLCLILAGPAMLLWASRVQLTDENGPDAQTDALEVAKIMQLGLPNATARPEGFAAFGKAFENGPIRAHGDAPGLLRMNIGDMDPKHPDALLSALPSGLRHEEKERTGLGPKGTLTPGLNYAMLSPQALAAKQLDAVLEGIRGSARIVGYGPNATLVLYVEAGQIGRLRQNPDVAFFQAMPPGDKISLDTGLRPLIERARALDPNFLLEVALVPGVNAAAVREAIDRVPGVVHVSESGPEGSALMVRMDHGSLGKLARIPEVLSIQESLEMMQTNGKNGPAYQTGGVQETNQARPFDDLGVDGGGIDTNGDGQRVNSCPGTACDTVPPQLVGVLDNGISADTPSFSQTATGVSDITHGFPGATHRKVHSIINTSGDGGNDCDAILHGGGSHGNVVASVIAAWPTGVGALATRNGIGGSGSPRNSNLDGVARGARIIVNDIADSSQCTLNSLVERGGNVSPGTLLTRLKELICPSSGGTGVCAGIVGGNGGADVHLAVTPFGAPDNFSTRQFQLNDGTYPQQSADLDTFLYNNRDFLVFGPAGNSGVLISSSRASFWTPRVIPDLFDGSSCDQDPNRARKAIQIPPPSTAKNIVAVGITRADEFTTFEQFDNMANMATFSSRGPATPESLRMAPIVVGPGSDLGAGPRPEFASVAVFRSRDDDNLNPVDAQIDEANYGSSYAAAGATGAAAIVRDYFAQGLYPTGDRVTANRVPNVSGALVKAALVASARFTTNIRTPGETTAAGQTVEDRTIRRTRSVDIGTLCGNVPIGVIGNSEQGYGRIVLTNVLPIPNWSKGHRLGGVAGDGTRWTAGNTPPGVSHWEHPAQGLLAWDDIATGEPAIDNTHTTQTHTFRVAGPVTTTALDGGQVVARGQLRVALAWTDPPSLPGTGGPLINDLDLVLEGPGPDNCLGGVTGETKPDGTACPGGSAADNRFYDGNNYPGTQNPFADQWSKQRLVGQTEVHDKRNPQEAIHLSFDRNNNTSATDSQIHIGLWRVTVKRGTGGAIPGQITITGANEDLDPDGAGPLLPNRRLDTGEDTPNSQCTAAGSPSPCCTGLGTGTCTGPGNGLLDLAGQTYALVVAGPVYLAEAAPARGPSQFPASSITLNKDLLSCDDLASATILDSSTGAGASRSTASTTFTVRTAAGVVVDTETGIGFTAASSPAGATTSSTVPVKLLRNPVANNGILEADNGMFVSATYAPAGQAPVVASGKVDCNPDFVPGFFGTLENKNFPGTVILGSNVIGPQYSITGGCDNDDSLDAGEVVTYGVALNNRGRDDTVGTISNDYGDIVATLTPSGLGAGAISVIDSPKNIGRLPSGQVQGVFFHVAVNAAAANALPIANRVVTMTLTLDSTNTGRRLSRQSYAFTHAINADKETLHYSTDCLAPSGSSCRQVRDLNRNQIIDRPDVLDPVKLFFLPDEDVTFSSMFTLGADNPSTPTVAAELISNTLGEDLNNNGILDASEADVVPNNNTLDRGILGSAAGPGAADKVPWNFDSSNGGWVPIRHPGSTAAGISANPMWEYKGGGVCTAPAASIGRGCFVSIPDCSAAGGGGVCTLHIGVCGFQTSGPAPSLGKYGIWHTGDGNVLTPGPAATACDNYVVPNDSLTEAKVELVLDVLQSPVIAKVNQLPDSRGFNYGVEFQRLAMNINDEVINAGYAAAAVNIDNNLDVDTNNCFLCQQLDTYYARTQGGWPYGIVFHLGGAQPFNGEGIDPTSTTPFQRTFGPFNDPNVGGPFDGGGETGFTGNISVPGRTSPIPTALPDYVKFPQTAASVPGVCTGGTTPGAPCQVDANCPGGTCALEQVTIAGPVRNFEGTLVGFEGGFSIETLTGSAAPETFGGGFIFNAGPAGNRWGIGIGFYSIESAGLLTDYGFGVDDVVFEWDETHPKDESAFTPAHTAACSRFGTPGNPAGGQCATIAVDRANLYECEEAVEITVADPKLGAGVTSVQVMVVTDSDADLFSTDRFTVLKPNAKRYTLPAVQQGLFRGNVTFSGTTDLPNSVFSVPGVDSTFIVYYLDPGCDADGDGQTAEDLFDNLDGDGIPTSAPDNCFLIYNPGQEDADGDGIGNLCDNCPNAANPTQDDANTDGVGDACEFDDVDGDGTANGSDDCPDLYNFDQAGTCSNVRVTCQSDADCTAPGTCDKSTGHGFACSNPTGDLDGDGRFDAADNCVLTPNQAGLPVQDRQRNTDLDGLGDACDGDCPGVGVVRICSNSPLVPATCTSNTDCPAGGVCQTAVRHTGTGPGCSNVDDDADADGVEDPLDNCAAIYNPTPAFLPPGSKRQLDNDRDGLGDACDPAGSQDDDFDGVPDDLVSFQGTVNCQELPLANFTVLQAVYQDIDGDHDSFPDAGETGLVTVRIRNNGVALTGATFILKSADPGVDCVTFPAVAAASIPAGATVTLGSLTPLQAGSSFTFRASNSLQSTASSTATIDLCVAASSNEVLGGQECFRLLADLDIPAGVSQTFIAGPDGLNGTADDGTLRETFDIDRNGDGNFTIDDAFRLTDAGTGLTGHAFYVHGSATGVGANTLTGVPCGGFIIQSEGNPECRLDPDHVMDWHYHCSPTATNCPNTESGANPDAGAHGPCPRGVCSYNTPADGQRALTAPNSMHMGGHFDTQSVAVGDGSHLRTLQAFVSNPINLAIVPRAGTNDLQMSFFQIVDLVDNNAVSMGPGLCADCAQVQVQIDRDPNPAVDNWGTWDTLAPFENVYTHTVRAWSTFGGQYCQETPGPASSSPNNGSDMGSASPAPRGVHETMCFGPTNNWSHCGSAGGTDEVQTFQCQNGLVDPSGKGVWVQTRFNLDGLLGQRVRIRWIGHTWQLDQVTRSYFEYGPGWAETPHDDGWWLDNIDITGVITRQTNPVPDPKPAPATACPATAADNCNENASSTDKGTVPRIKATDLSGNVFTDTVVPVAGQAIFISGVDSTIPGGCTDGGPQFQFIKNGAVVQDWSSKPSFKDTPETYNPVYSVLVRCSSDTTCTSLTAASLPLAIYDGANAASDGNVTLNVSYDRAAATTTLTPAGAALVDIYKGAISTPGVANGFTGLGPTWQHVATSCYLNNQTLPVPAQTQAADPNPALGRATFYVANAAQPGVLNGALGCVNPSRCFAGSTPNAPCSTNAACGAGGTCLNLGLAGALGSNGCPTANPSPQRVNSSAAPASANVCKN